MGWLRRLFGQEPQKEDGRVSARPGESNSKQLADGRTATVSVDKRGRSASITIE